MRSRGMTAVAVVLFSIGCSKTEPAGTGTAAAESSAAPAANEPKQVAAPPADAKSIAAFREGNPQAGAQAKIHGYVGSVKGDAWPLVGKVGDTMPFVFCKMASPPADVKKGAHVVAVGKVEDQAMLQECTLTAL